ncbi:hypothetical protein [Bradyrhizobium elkanii]|uniref:hypothetical protein n=1 Tax=Bradyrhizobium elkanii TaxID=29448 RepID=UPI0003F9CA63|nr:hypothetical protein [Bradyrhizobium elkanii]
MIMITAPKLYLALSAIVSVMLVAAHRAAKTDQNQRTTGTVDSGHFALYIVGVE